MEQNTTALLTLGEAAKALRISKTKLYWERRDGKIRTVQIGRATRITPADLNRYIAALRGSDPSPAR